MATITKKFNRFTQATTERLALREKSDRLTEKLSEAEKKMAAIRHGCNSTVKKLHACAQGSGSTVEKHQKKLPQFALGNAMTESGKALGGVSVLGNCLQLVGEVQLEISQHLSDHEIYTENDVTQALSTLIEEECKKIDKAKKKLHNARLDMDSTRNKYHSLQDKYTPRAETLKAELDTAINHFEQCQDLYATTLFQFLSQERELAMKIHKLVILQITWHKQALGCLESVLPHLDKQMDNTVDRPTFGFPLEEHLKITGRTISAVIEECCLAIRDKWMDVEGIFRLAGSASKLKLLKNAFDAGVVDLSGHDPNTIAGVLKQYLRELPEPLLTHDLYDDWMKAVGIGDEGERLQQLWIVCKKLPTANMDNLKFLMYFFNDLAKHSDQTKMHTNNLAIVIGPNLLWPKTESSLMDGMVGNTALYTRLAECFIKHTDYFFGEPETPSPMTQRHVQPAQEPSNQVAPEVEEKEEDEQVKREMSASSVTDRSEHSIRSEHSSQSEHSASSPSNGDSAADSSPASVRNSVGDESPVVPSGSGTPLEGRPTPPVRRIRKPPPPIPTPYSGSPHPPSPQTTPTGPRQSRRPAPVPPAGRAKSAAKQTSPTEIPEETVL